MSVKQKIEKVAAKLKKAGFDVRNPDHDPKGNNNIRWIFPKPGSDNQVGCIHVSTNNSNQVHAYFEL